MNEHSAEKDVDGQPICWCSQRELAAILNPAYGHLWVAGLCPTRPLPKDRSRVLSPGKSDG